MPTTVVYSMRCITPAAAANLHTNAACHFLSYNYVDLLKNQLRSPEIIKSTANIYVS